MPVMNDFLILIVSVSTFHTRDDGKSELRVAYRLLPPDAEEDKEDEEDSILITSSGRIVKQNSSFNLRDSLSNKSVSVVLISTV